MREGLKNINGVRKRFIATFERYGKKAAYKGLPITTLLFLNLRDVHGDKFCDHVWFTTCKGFEQYEFNEGDNISFDARVKEYYKGYRGRRDEYYDDVMPISKDYKLSHPNNIIKNTIAKALQLF